MGPKRKTWQEKLADREDLPKILTLEKSFPCFNAVRKMGAEVGDPVVLVNPSEVTACMKQVPPGNLTTITEICRRLADKHGAKGCCFLTTGIFIMITANAAGEAKTQDKDLQVPYWRTLKTDGFLNDKYPGGVESHRALLEQEGFTVVGNGKRLRVDNYRAHSIEI